MSDANKKTAKKLVRNEIYAGNIPTDVDLIYFPDDDLQKIGSRFVVVAIKAHPENSSFDMGYAVFRRDKPNERIDKKGLRTTAYMRLRDKTITVAGPDLEQRRDETDVAYRARCAMRKQQWEDCFGIIGVEKLKNWPSTVFRHATESDAEYQDHVVAANKSYLAKFPDTPPNTLDDLRAKKAAILQKRRSFIRQAVHANPVPMNADVVLSNGSVSMGDMLGAALFASMVGGRREHNQLRSSHRSSPFSSRSDASGSFAHRVPKNIMFGQQ